MKQKVLNALLGGALLLSAPMFTSCEDILGTWERPSGGSSSGGGSSAGEGVEYVAYTVSGSTATPSNKTATTYTEVTSSTTTWAAGTYVVSSDVTIDGNVTLSGDVELILCDGKTLTVNGSIQTEFVSSYNPINSLAVYAQSGGTGALVIAPTVSDTPGIYVKTLDIYGGAITATGNGAEAGIESSNEMNIYAGTITTTGGNGIMNYGSNILSIYNATITATGTTGNGIQSAAGITMYSGNVTAIGGDAASGSNSDGAIAISVGGADTGTLTVNGGTLNATGGAKDGTGNDGTGISTVNTTITLGTGITFYEGDAADATTPVATTPITCSKRYVEITTSTIA